ncbi:unnamed protein product, partial [Musa hybrid cultivar]
ILRSGYLPHVKAWSAVVSRLSSSPDDGGPAEALRLFDSVLRRVRRVTVATDARPDVAAFNAALNACANLGDVRRFAQLFDEMPEFGVEPDVLTHNVLIKMCARAERKDLLIFVLERLITSGLVPCITTLHSLVAAYVGLDDLETAEKLLVMYRHLTECHGNGNEPPLLPKAYFPDSRMYTTLMKGYVKEGRVEDVIRMTRAMQLEADPASHPDHVTYTTVISALIKVGAMDRARSVLADMGNAGVPANRVTYNVLLKGYCQQLQLDEAKELVRDMSKHAGIEPNVVSYNILIDGCILVDDSAGALAYFNEMRERGITPSKVSYTTLMKAFALSGQPKLAHKVFDEMEKDPRVKVDRVAYNMLIEGYCRLGLIEEAKKIVDKMKQNGFQPDVATYGSLANGIALARKPGEALLLWNEVKERCAASPPLRPDEGLLDALADVCVRAAFFRKALEIVACMEENGISPNKTKYKRIYVEMHSRMFTSKHASQARQDRRKERKRAAEAFKFWLGLPNSYYGSEWRLEPIDVDEHGAIYHLTKGYSRPRGGESKNMEGRRKWTSALKKALIPSCCRDYGKSKRSSRAATEVGRSTISEATAATKIQAAFRGFLARRAMGTLKRLIRLKNLIDGSAVGSQTANMVRRLQAMAVVQAQVRSRRMRMAEDHQALLRQLQLKQEREQQKAKIGEWNDSPRSKEQIEAKLLDRQEAATRRERALAYAFARQGKSSSKSPTPMFIDLNNLQWGWSLSERLTAAGPQEKHGHDAVKPKRIPSAAQRPSQAPVTPRSNPASKASVNPSKSKPSPRNESPVTPRSKLASVASKKTPVSPGTGAWSADDGSSIRSRHRVTRSSVSDDSSLSSALSVASYTPSTASTKARSRFHSPQSDVAEGSQKGSVGSGKKRLPSPAAGKNKKNNGSSHARRTK